VRICLITDQHFDSRDGNKQIGDFQNRFYEEVFFPFLDKNPDIKTVIDLGDTFDRRKNVNFTSLKRAKENYFTKLRDRGIILHSIIGNHTAALKNTNEVNTMELLFGEYDNIRVYKDPTEVNIGGLDLLMLPWICSGNYVESMAALKKTKADIVLGHLELKGFQMYKGVINDHGMETDVFGKFDMVMSGHFHHKSSQGNIHYLGAPYEMNWSDCNDKRGFHVFDTEDRSLTHIKNPLKLFHKLNYDERQFTLEELQKIDLSSFRGCNIKVIVIQNTDRVMFDTLIRRLEDASPADVQVIEDFSRQATTVDYENLDETDDALTIVSKYVDQIQGITNKSKIDSLMQSLYSEAMNLS
jgi:DNA repair exonuclease SbcCD nuclease subunit